MASHPCLTRCASVSIGEWSRFDGHFTASFSLAELIV